jgi:dephospho-CoA kinase
MLRAALTGGIATGKSACLARFAALGVPVIDADTLAREAVAPGTPGLAAVAGRFGSAVLHPDGSLDRPALARIVFADPAARADLEAIIHPRVFQIVQTWAVNLPPGTAVSIADIPLLFETGHNHQFDFVIVSACDPALQLRRLMDRDKLAEADAMARIAAQWPIAEKVKRADYVIWTDGTFAETEAQVRAVYERLTARAAHS